MAKKIIIVEDDKELIDLLVPRLRREGYDVVGCQTGQSALEKIRMYLPDLVILDIMLPDMDGSEVARELQKEIDTAAVPVLFLSGMVSGDAEGGSISELNVGGFKYPALGKPFSPRELIDLIADTMA
jgi:DNA-binding response OmpR family regulator